MIFTKVIDNIDKIRTLMLMNIEFHDDIIF